MTLEEAIAFLKSDEAWDDAPAAIKLGEAVDLVVAELKRFREREPLVQALLRECENVQENDGDPLDKAIEALRDFKLTEDKP